MRGDIDNTQAVLLDGSPSARRRVIYSLRRVPEQRVQFGTVSVDYGIVAVWRPYDPSDDRWDAPWQSVPWRNVYRIKVPQHPLPDRPGKVAYEIDRLTIGDVTASLPVAELVLSHALAEYLKSA